MTLTLKQQRVDHRDVGRDGAGVLQLLQQRLSDLQRVATEARRSEGRERAADVGQARELVVEREEVEDDGQQCGRQLLHGVCRSRRRGGRRCG